MEKPIIKIGRFEMTPGEARMIQETLNQFEWPERVEVLHTPSDLPNFEADEDQPET